MKFKDVMIVLGLALIMVAPALVAGEQGVPGNAGRQSDDPFKLETTRDRLIHRVDLWHDAILKGDQSAGEKHYTNIGEAIDEDIVISRRLLKLFAQQTLLQSAASASEEPNLMGEDSKQAEMKTDRQAIEDLAAVINTKVALKEALDRATAFSNRYRLLGDYINLLRKELDIPKVRLAYESMQSSQASTD